jgi:hypothetical protein
VKLELIEITDKSGSMSDIRNDVIGGYNAMLEDNKKLPGQIRVTQVQFDDVYELNFQGVDIQKVDPLTHATYCPRGMTALLDAIGYTLEQQGHRIKSEGWADKVLVSIRTDGQENSSKEYKLPRIKEMIEHAQKHGWIFLFSGADIDAFSAAKSMGIPQQNASGYSKSDPLGTIASYAVTGQTLRSLVSLPDDPVTL